MGEENSHSLKTKKWLIRIVLVCVALYLGFQGFMELYAPIRKLNFRLDVTFEVDGEQITGSGVQTCVARKSILSFLLDLTYEFDLYGEAVIVDLPNRSSVFVLMNSPRDDGSIQYDSGSYVYIVISACRLREKAGKLGPAEYIRFIGSFTGSCEVKPKDVPVIVHFQDELDPSTIERVFPDKPEQVLGPGVRFVGARIQITDAPITTGIRDRLTWLTDFGSRSLSRDAPTSNPSLTQKLKHRHFQETK